MLIVHWEDILLIAFVVLVIVAIYQRVTKKKAEKAKMESEDYGNT